MSAAQQAWTAYRDAAGALGPATLSEDAMSDPDSAAVDELLRRSEALAGALKGHLGAADVDERELATLQLEAAAAVDLERANALAAMADGIEVEATLSGARWEEIDRILATPTEQGIHAVLDVGGGGFEATASDDGTLTEAVGAAVDAIVKDAGDAAGTTFNALAGIPGNDLLDALGKGAEEVFGKVGGALEGGLKWLKRKAVELALKAMRKLLAVFGPHAEVIRRKIEEWIDKLDGDKVAGFLPTLYGVESLKERFGVRLEAAPNGISDECDKTARDELAVLQAKWHKRMTVIDIVGELAPLARKWIFAVAPPWSALAYTATFGLAGGYVVLGGGDYVDWRETDGVLDLVPGVGAIVDRVVAC